MSYDAQVVEFRKDLEEFEDLMAKMRMGSAYRIDDIRSAQQKVYVSREGFQGAQKDYEREYKNVRTNYRQIQEVQNNLIQSQEEYRNAYSNLLVQYNALSKQCKTESLKRVIAPEPIKRVIAESPPSSPSALSTLATVAADAPQAVVDPVWDLIQRINPSSLDIKSEPTLLNRFNAIMQKRLRDLQKPRPGDDEF